MFPQEENTNRFIAHWNPCSSVVKLLFPGSTVWLVIAIPSVLAQSSRMAFESLGSNAVDLERFELAIRRFDEVNAHDPNLEEVAGELQPRELVHARRLTEWVFKLCPNASETLWLAARCQHISRWEMPRSAYPMTRAGYLEWRNALKAFHAEKAGKILGEAGYPIETIHLVQQLNLKKNFPHDFESRVLEDALCLVFLQYQLDDLAAKTPDGKMVNALRKSWQKMTPAGRELALKLSLGQREQALVERALGM